MKKNEINKRKEKYVTGFKLIEDKTGKVTSIKVFLNNGESFPAAYNKANLEKLRNDMLEGAKYEKTKLAPKKTGACIGYTILSVAGAAGFAILNITEFGKEISPVIPSTASLVVGIASGAGALKNYCGIANIKRNATFAYHKDEINAAIIENPYVYLNLSAKDKATIEKWLQYPTNEPITIENIHYLNPETIYTILKNIKLSKQFGMKYREEQGNQKTLKQV